MIWTTASLQPLRPPSSKTIADFCSSVHNICFVFPLWLLCNLSLFVFQQSDYDVLWFGFLCVYSAWDLLSFLGSVGLYISSTLEVFSHDFAKYFFASLSLCLLFAYVVP